MNERIIVLALAAALFALGAPVQGQQPTKIPRIGFLFGFSPSVNTDRVEAFRQGLREIGYTEGQNIDVEYRWTEGKFERLPDLAAELIGLKVDIIVTHGEAAIRALKKATKTIPIVVAVTGDLVATGHAASLARPGGNITGLVDTSPELSGKRLELLTEVVPGISRVGVIWNGANRVKVLDFKETEIAVRAFGLKSESLEVRVSKDFDNRFKPAATQGYDALVVLQDALTISKAGTIVDFARKRRLPAIYGSSEFIDRGGLMSYAAKFPDLFRRAATYVDKILKGAKPADLPIEQPTRFELVIDLKTARQIGLTIPPNVLARADRVIR